jgi:hypothetical protein
MAVTLNSTGITFSNGQTLATNAPTGTLSGIQYTAYQTQNFAGFQNYTTSDTFTANDFIGFYPGFSRNTNSQLIVGITYYRSANLNNAPGIPNNDANRAVDGATMNWRTVYRTVNGL